MHDLPALLAAINTTQGTGYTLMERYAGGEQGAYRLRECDGHEAVLKWSLGRAHAERVQRATAMTERLRHGGYPAPRSFAVGVVEGVSYSIQEALRGQPLGSLTPEFVPAAIALNALQAGAAGDLPRHWSAPVRDPLLYGGKGFCLYESLRSHSAETAQLLDRLRGIAQSTPEEPWPDGDIVHYDFSPANILASNGAISGVIDWEGVCAGDRAFDLATLWFYSDDTPATDALLHQYLQRAVEAQRLQLYVAHMALRQLDWSIRFHDELAVQRWLHRAQATLALVT